MGRIVASPPPPPPRLPLWPSTTTSALLATLLAVLSTVVLLYWRIHRRLSRRPLERGGSESAGMDVPRISHVRSNLCELADGIGQATPEQRAEYAELCAQMVQDACAYIDPDGAGRHIRWARCADVRGVQVWLARMADSPIVVIKGCARVRIPDIAALAGYFFGLNTTEALRRSLEKLDPMFRDGRIICRLGAPPRRAHGKASAERAVPDGGANGADPAAEAAAAFADEAVRPAPVAGEMPPGKAQVEWACFAAPPPLAPRDFCWLEHTSFARAPDGSRLFFSLCSSVQREEAPDMWQSHGYVRAELTSTGYVFRQSAEGSDDWDLFYVVQIDPKGIVPKWVVNLVATDQAANAAAMRDAVTERTAAEEVLRGPDSLVERRAPVVEARTAAGASGAAVGCGAAAAPIGAAPRTDEGPRWRDVPLQEALLPRDGGAAVVSLGQLAEGQRVEWRWVGGCAAEAEHAQLGCQLEMEILALPLDADATASRAVVVEHEHCELRATGAAGASAGAGAPVTKVHACSARTHASAHHWLAFRRQRTLIERMRWTATRPLTVFLQVRVS